MLDTLFNGNSLGFLQRMDGSRRNVLHLISWEETAEVQGIVCKAVIHYPAAHLANHRHVIVHTRDDEIRQFNPHTCFLHSQDGIEDWLQVATADLLIDIIAKRL